eukprot:SAG25_NODE_7724_length_463_cov_1.390110_1_plen_124_part_01
MLRAHCTAMAAAAAAAPSTKFDAGRHACPRRFMGGNWAERCGWVLGSNLSGVAKLSPPLVRALMLLYEGGCLPAQDGEHVKETARCGLDGTGPCRACAICNSCPCCRVPVNSMTRDLFWVLEPT